ncbi:GAF domain-containing protein [Rheinheimera sp.]|uniref:GAF domain-containing protein n=1 Tax=Rheinheimera sp. TaxID=1869214 RepID=UPI004047368A
MSQSDASITEYLALAGLAVQSPDVFAATVLRWQQSLQQYLQQVAPVSVQWQYKVPELGEGGACSLFGQLADEPYDLTAILGGQSAHNQQALQLLSAIAAFYREHSGLDWFGIYQARANVSGEPVLVKLAYYGAASRAEFPLNSDFAKISNNSTVGLSGKAKIINDVAAYLGSGGEYYTCDPKVQAEACLPLFNQSGKIVGIVDAEDFNKNVFTADAQALLVAVCLTIPAYLP